MSFKVHVRITPRPGLLDPQGQAVEHALDALGFPGVRNVRIGRAIDLTVDAASSADAEATTRRMCERLLANPVIEDFLVEVES
jgi:phosphoribosylformylglycinamidine synthase